jgi:hypothetical protein
MKSMGGIFVLPAALASTAIYDTLFPTEKPVVVEDPVDCIFEDFYPYFSALTPNGSLSTALLSYGDVLIKDCPLTEVDVMGLPTCPYPALSDWCAFSDHAPTSLLPEWSSYGSAASSWWGHNSADAVRFARVCKKKWFNAMIGVVYGSVRLNNTIHWGECYAQANPTSDGKGRETSTSTPSAANRATSLVPQETSIASKETEEEAETESRDIEGEAKAEATPSTEQSGGNPLYARSRDAWLMAGMTAVIVYEVTCFG